MFIMLKISHEKKVTFSVKCSVFSLCSIEICICEACNLYENMKQNGNESTFSVFKYLAYYQNFSERKNQEIIGLYSLEILFLIELSDFSKSPSL